VYIRYILWIYTADIYHANLTNIRTITTFRFSLKQHFLELFQVRQCLPKVTSRIFVAEFYRPCVLLVAQPTAPNYHHHTTTFLWPFPGPPRWAGARRELLDCMVQGKINRGRHTDLPAGRHSIWTNQCSSPLSHIPFFTSWKPFLTPNQQCQSTEGNSKHWRQQHQTTHTYIHNNKNNASKCWVRGLQ